MYIALLLELEIMATKRILQFVFKNYSSLNEILGHYDARRNFFICIKCLNVN